MGWWRYQDKACVVVSKKKRAPRDCCLGPMVPPMVPPLGLHRQGHLHRSLALVIGHESWVIGMVWWWVTMSSIFGLGPQSSWSPWAAMAMCCSGRSKKATRGIFDSTYLLIPASHGHSFFMLGRKLQINTIWPWAAEADRFGADAANALEANPESTSGHGATFSATMQTESKAIGCMKQPPVNNCFIAQVPIVFTSTRRA